MNAFAASVARVLQGTVVAQAIGMLALPLLTRQFPPQAFGYLQLFSTALSLGLVAVSMRYEVAILQTRYHENVAALIRLCFLITAAVTLLTALVCALLLAFFGPWSAGTSIILWLLAPGLLLGGMLQTLGYLPLRLKDFRIVARANGLPKVEHLMRSRLVDVDQACMPLGAIPDEVLPLDALQIDGQRNAVADIRIARDDALLLLQAPQLGVRKRRRATTQAQLVQARSFAHQNRKRTRTDLGIKRPFIAGLDAVELLRPIRD